MEELKVVDELVLGFGFEVDFGEGRSVGVDGMGVELVEDLRVGDASAQLLDFSVGGFSEGVDPGEEIVAGGLEKGRAVC